MKFKNEKVDGFLNLSKQPSSNESMKLLFDSSNSSPSNSDKVKFILSGQIICVSLRKYASLVSHMFQKVPNVLPTV